MPKKPLKKNSPKQPKELTIAEMVHYANYTNIEICELCGNWVPLSEIEVINNQLLCKKCKL
jgi:formylmethanofuran dehydrogenase subunit E